MTSNCQHGQCLLDGFNYRCNCHQGFTGPTCSQAVTTAAVRSLTTSCGLDIETAYYIDPLTKCTSHRRLRMTKCSGLCPLPSSSSILTNRTLSSSCCTPIEPKRRFFRMTCASGFTYKQSLDLFKQCACSNNTVC